MAKSKQDSLESLLKPPQEEQASVFYQSNNSKQDSLCVCMWVCVYSDVKETPTLIKKPTEVLLLNENGSTKTKKWNKLADRCFPWRSHPLTPTARTSDCSYRNAMSGGTAFCGFDLHIKQWHLVEVILGYTSCTSVKPEGDTRTLCFQLL